RVRSAGMSARGRRTGCAARCRRSLHRGGRDLREVAGPLLGGSELGIHPWVWAVTVGVLIVILAVDVFIIGRRPHEPSMREAGLAITFFVALAAVFGIGVWIFAGGRYAGEFFAGWITEYSLSVDDRKSTRLNS